MGLFDKFKGELIDIIEWIDDTNDTLGWRFERHQNEIKNGAKMTVREGQKAAFINKGQLADVFDPGMYTLNTENLPFLSTIMGWAHGFNSPFKAEVYFISTRLFTDMKWGTPNPIMLRDPEFGPIRIRARGNYSIQVLDVPTFIKDLVGTDGNFNTNEISDQLRNILITRFTDMIGESKLSALDMASQYNEMSDMLLEKVKPDFERYGITIEKALIENITLPETVEQALDKRSSMGIIGDMSKYSQYQMAESMDDLAKNPGGGGMAAGGMGMGMGMAMANQMSNMMNQPGQQGQQAPPPPPPQKKFHVVVNGKQQGPFPMQAIVQHIQSGSIKKETLVWTQGMPQWSAAGTVGELASFFQQSTPPPPPPPSS